MLITFKSKHRNNGKRNPSRKGQIDFVYTVTGTPQEQEDFKTTQGKFYLEGDKGEALMVSSRDLGENAPLVKRTTDGRWVAVVDSKDIAITKLAKLAGKFPVFAPQFGEKASAIAVAEEVFTPAPVQATVSAPAVVGADLAKS